MLDKFAEELRAAREKSGITLQQIAQKSRIDLKYIQAIDKGDFSFLPELYVKAFIKQFAKIVGFDEQAAIKKYEAAKSGKAPLEKTEPEKPAGTEENSSPDTPPVENKPEPPKVQKPVKSFQESSDKKPEMTPVTFYEKLKTDKRLLIGVIAGAVIILLALVYFLFIRQSSDIIVAEKPYEEIRKENQQRYIPEEQPGQISDGVSVTSADSLNLIISATDTTWIRMKLDGREVQEFKLYPNTDRSIRAAVKISMIVGNAGATKMKLNDKQLNFSGKKNEVRYVSIDKNGLKYINTPPTF